MPSVRFDVLAIGNAIIDLVASAEDDLLLREGLRKGSMTLIDEERSNLLAECVNDSLALSGGSAANTAVGIASLGGRSAFIGKVKADPAGIEFAREIRSSGVHFETPPALNGPATARCLVLVTPDGERTMTTFLGACQRLSKADIDEDLVAQSAFLYLEGYLWDPPEAKEAFLAAAKVAHQAGNRVALTLSDEFCVDRYRDEFRFLLTNQHVDVLFANEHELKSLYQTGDFDAAVKSVTLEKCLAVITRSEKGCVVVDSKMTAAYPAFPIENLIDTTGAGDLFAAGFLRGITTGKSHEDSAKLAALAAAEVIQHFGARPLSNLGLLAKEHGLI